MNWAGRKRIAFIDWSWAKPETRDSPGEEQTYIAVYFGVMDVFRWPRAKLVVFRNDDLELRLLPSMFLPDGSFVILDPLAIVFNETLRTVDYTPRMYADQQPRWVADWLHDYPGWAVPGCELNWGAARRKRSA